MSTLSNFALLAVVARQTEAETFGLFALLYATYAFLTQVEQALITEPFLVRFSGPVSSNTMLPPALRAGFQLGALGALPLVVASLVSSSPVRVPALLLAACMPLLLLQDTQRLVAIAREKPLIALVIDAVWALVEFPLLLAHGHSLNQCVAIWAISGAVSAVVGWALARKMLLGPAPRRNMRLQHRGGLIFYVQQQRQLSLPYLVETLVLAGSTNGLLFVVGGIVGVASAGALRAGQALFGPLNLFLNVARLAGLAELARARAHGKSMKRPTVQLVVALTGLASLLSASLLLLPGAVGRWLFSDTWDQARAILPLLALQKVVLAANVGIFATVRVLKHATGTMFARLTVGLSTLLLGSLGCLWCGLPGVVVGLTLGEVIGFLVLGRRVILLMKRD